VKANDLFRFQARLALALLRDDRENCLAKKKQSTSKRQLIDTGRVKMFGKRTAKGRFVEMDEVSRSLGVDRRKKAKTKIKSGHGDQGDRAASSGRKTAGTSSRKTTRKTSRKKTTKKSR
jgi:hypothetical protein